MDNGYIRTSFSNNAGTYHQVLCTQCGEKRGTCRKSHLLRGWEEDHRLRCAVQAQAPKPQCNQPGCLHCNP